MMRLLALETSGEDCSVALSADGYLWHRGEHAPREHARLLLPWIAELMDESGLSMADLDAVVFSCGPGSFTSLRIGIGVAQGLAWGANLPVIPVSSLQLVAQSAALTGATEVLVCMDARMGEVYCGCYKACEAGIMKLSGSEQVLPPDDAAALAGAHMTAVGNGFYRYEPLTRAAKTMARALPGLWPDARAMIPLAIDWLESNDPLPAERAQPVYIRDKVAEKPA